MSYFESWRKSWRKSPRPIPARTAPLLLEVLDVLRNECGNQNNDIRRIFRKYLEDTYFDIDALQEDLNRQLMTLSNNNYSGGESEYSRELKAVNCFMDMLYNAKYDVESGREYGKKRIKKLRKSLKKSPRKSKKF